MFTCIAEPSLEIMCQTRKPSWQTHHFLARELRFIIVRMSMDQDWTGAGFHYGLGSEPHHRRTEVPALLVLATFLHETAREPYLWGHGWAMNRDISCSHNKQVQRPVAGSSGKLIS